MATDTLPEEAGQQSEKTFEGSRVVSSPDGWITTSGVFYPCSPQEHDECAKYLLRTHIKFIETLLIESEHYEMVGSRSDYNAREILKAAGFALLSDNQLSEANLPETLSLKQMEFANRNNLIFMPISGQLDLRAYETFQERSRDLMGVKKLLERKNIVLKRFLDDPTKTIHISDNDPFANELFTVLTEGFTAQVSLKLGKGIVIWRRLNIPSNDNVFLEYEYHDHTGGGAWETTPETEAFLLLTNKQGVKEYLSKKERSGSYPKGDLSVLN